jgi:hypothetical protein
MMVNMVDGRLVLLIFEMRGTSVDGVLGEPPLLSDVRYAPHDAQDTTPDQNADNSQGSGVS